jgi:hypothetical protein
VVDESADHDPAKTVRDQERLRHAAVARRREHGECTALLGTEHHKPGKSARSTVGHFSNLPSFVIAPLDPVEELSGLFLGKHHADITGRNPCRTLRIKFVALHKQHAFVEGIIRNISAGADQRGRLDDDHAVQSTASVVAEPPKRHLARNM